MRNWLNLKLSPNLEIWRRPRDCHVMIPYPSNPSRRLKQTVRCSSRRGSFNYTLDVPSRRQQALTAASENFGPTNPSKRPPEASALYTWRRTCRASNTTHDATSRCTHSAATTSTRLSVPYNGSVKSQPPGCFTVLGVLFLDDCAAM